MREILKAFWDIALWRRDPGHLPDSVPLLAVTTAVYAVLSVLQSWLLFGTDRLLARTAADLVFSVLPLWVLLRVMGRAHRFNQTMTAVLGTGALLTPLVMLLQVVHGAVGAGNVGEVMVWAGSVAVVLWYIFIVGHILRSALDTGTFTGVAVAVAYLVANMQLMMWLFPEGA